MNTLIVCACVLVAITACSVVTVENMSNAVAKPKPTLAERAKALVCAYYAFRHDPALDLSVTPVFDLYELEWKKKTSAVALPYVYEYLFFDMHHYVLFESRRGKEITYNDLLVFITPAVREIYTKNEPLLTPRKPSAKLGKCVLEEIIAPVTIFNRQMDVPVIYNNNKGRNYFHSREFLPNDRAGNNTSEKRP